MTKLTCVSFNVNSLRQRLHQVDAIIKRHRADIIGLQETKVADDMFPEDSINDLGYDVKFYGQKTHYGVALMTQDEFVSCQRGLEGGQEQRRFIASDIKLENGEHLKVINGYFPQGERRDHPNKFVNKRDFYRGVIEYLKNECDPKENLVVMGDFNVAPTDEDVGFSDQERTTWLEQGICSFLPEEREWLAELMAFGLTDTLTPFRSRDTSLSWFDYRNRGFEQEPKKGLRIDFILASTSMVERCIGAGIDYDIRGMEKPSDHCPVWATFSL